MNSLQYLGINIFLFKKKLLDANRKAECLTPLGKSVPIAPVGEPTTSGRCSTYWSCSNMAHLMSINYCFLSIFIIRQEAAL